MALLRPKTSGQLDAVCPVDWLSPLNAGLAARYLSVPGWAGGPTLPNLCRAGDRDGLHGTLTDMAIPATATSGWGDARGRPGGYGSLAFDGTSDYVTVPGGAGTTSVFHANILTVACWAYLTSASNFPCMVARSQGTNDVLAGIELRCNSTTGVPQFLVDTSSANRPNATGTTSIVGGWHHIVGTYDGTTIRVYADGAETGNTASTGTIEYGTPTALTIGRRAGGAALYWPGRLDDVCVWPGRALSAGQVRQWYEDSRAGSPATLRWLPARAWSIPEAGAPSGAMSGTAAITFTPAATLAGAGALAGSSALVFDDGTSTLTGAGTLAGTATVAFGAGTSTLAGSGALAGTSAVVFTAAGALEGAAPDALVGTAALTFTPSATLTGSGALAGVAALLFGGTPTLTGTGALAGTGAVTFGAGASSLSGTGTLSGAAALALMPSGTLAGSGALAGTAAITFTVATVSAGELAGTAALTFTATASPTALGTGRTIALAASVDTTHALYASVDTTFSLGASNEMSTRFEITVFRGEDVNLDFTLDPAVDITGNTITFSMADTVEDTPRITKTASIVSGPLGQFRVTLDSADIASLAVRQYVADCRRQPAGQKATLADGVIHLRREITA